MATGFQYSAFQPSGFQNQGSGGGGGAGTTCGFQPGAFQASAFQNCGNAATARYPAPAGAPGKAKRGKRKPYVIEGRKVYLDREELEEALEQLLVAPPVEREPDAPPVKVANKDRAIVAAFPAYPDVRDMLMAAQQIEAAQALRALAKRLADEEDERDVEVLLLWG